MIYSSPYRNQWFDCGPSEYRLRQGDHVVLDIGYCYRGYWADMYRTACIGKPDGPLDEFYHANRQATLSAIETVRPGVEIADLSHAANATWTRLGFAEQVQERIRHDWDCVGHGLGLTVHEDPLLTTKTNRSLRAGMYLAVEPKLKDRLPNDRAAVCVGIEDDVIVTSKSCERLTGSVSDELLVR